MRNDIKLTDDQITELYSQVSGYDIDLDGEENEYGSAVFTRETLADFMKNRRLPEHALSRDLETGIEYIENSGMQDRKGQPRYTLVVVDFGDVRIASKH